MHKRFYFVYIMTNMNRTALYVGVTNGLAKRVMQHRAGKTGSFTERYRVDRLVYYEPFEVVTNAIGREKQIKRWRRDKKEALINRMNTHWEDLAVTKLVLDPVEGTPWEPRGV